MSTVENHHRAINATQAAHSRMVAAKVLHSRASRNLAEAIRMRVEASDVFNIACQVLNEATLEYTSTQEVAWRLNFFDEAGVV